MYGLNVNFKTSFLDKMLKIWCEEKVGGGQMPLCPPPCVRLCPAPLLVARPTIFFAASLIIAWDYPPNLSFESEMRNLPDIHYISRHTYHEMKIETLFREIPISEKIKP